MEIQAQSVYMHEAQEEALEQEKEGGPFTGIVGILLFFGIVYVIGNLWDSHKDNQKQREEYKQKKKVSDSIANEHLVKEVSISKYQYKEAWQKVIRELLMIDSTRHRGNSSERPLMTLSPSIDTHANLATSFKQTK